MRLPTEFIPVGRLAPTGCRSDCGGGRPGVDTRNVVPLLSERPLDPSAGRKRSRCGDRAPHGDAGGIEVVLPTVVYAKILEEHPAVADLALIDRTIREPNERKPDPRPGRERFFRHERGLWVPDRRCPLPVGERRRQASTGTGNARRSRRAARCATPDHSSHRHQREVAARPRRGARGDAARRPPTPPRPTRRGAAARLTGHCGLLKTYVPITERPPSY
jgi:hypothetical protein